MGVPDLVALWPGRGGPLAAIEFKHGSNTVTAGGIAKVYDSAEDAFRFRSWYVGLTEESPPAGAGTSPRSIRCR